MPTAQDFINHYGDNPWQAITDKTRQIFVPDLLDVFRKSAFYQQFIPFSVDMLQSHAERMTFTTLYELEPNINPIGLRQMWVDGLRSDSERKSISMEHHGGKVVLHKFGAGRSKCRFLVIPRHVPMMLRNAQGLAVM